MSLLHVSIGAARPERVADILAQILGGPALPFPPCPGAYIAFTAADDGTAVEIYPATARVAQGRRTIEFATAPTPAAAGPVHVALSSPLPADQICGIGARAGWTARICSRGPFSCVELWVENATLIEVLDPEMLKDYRSGMTAASWRAMFGLGEE
ncbi:MAG: hypothetical protein AAF914_00270 [Pseudomonadota bacterium]